ncbi:exosome complex component Rrp4 [Nanoarchaeota archaeon]
MIIVPGDFVKTKDENVYENNGEYHSKYIGLLEESKNKITKLFGYYIPKLNDIVIGKVIDVLPIGWLIDINSPYLGSLLLKDMNMENVDPNDLYTYEDYILCQIIKITKNKIINLGIKKKEKLNDGLIIDIDPVKVPRIIGKNSSMLNMLKELLKVKIIVGQNGRIYINGDEVNVLRTVNAIKFIEENSYKKGLTEKVKEMIEKNII